MSERVYATVTAPSGLAATPVSQLKALSDGIGQLETAALATELRPVWDTLEISSEEDVDHIGFSLTGGHEVLSRTTFSLSVLTVDPKEVSE